MQEKPIALATEVNQEEEAYLKHALEAELSLRAISGTLNTQDASELREVEILLPFIHSKIEGAEISAMPHLKLITTRSTGYEHIDLQTTTAKRITVASVPAYGETAVAEYTFALLLTLSRKVNQAATQMKEGTFALEELRGSERSGLVELFWRDDCIFEIGLFQECPSEVCLSESGCTEVGIEQDHVAEIGPRKKSRTEISPLQIRFTQVGPAQICPNQVRIFQIGFA